MAKSTKKTKDTGKAKAASKAKAEVKQDPDAPPEVLPPSDGVAPGSIVRDLPEGEKPGPSSVAQEEEVVEFPPTEAVS